MRVLEVGCVDHGYGVGSHHVAVLHDVSLVVEVGEVVALTGASGSGKTTLCHLAAGIEAPDSGRVLVDGRAADQVASWSVVALVPQQHGLLAGLSVTDNIALPALHAGVDPAAAVADLCRALDLEHLARREVTETSLGEQQRVALARALVLRPRLAVLDEPTGHQDDDHVDAVLATLRTAAASGTAIVVASHDQRVWRAADRVVGLHEGRVVEP